MRIGFLYMQKKILCLDPGCYRLHTIIMQR